MGTEASRIQINERLSIIILLQRNYCCFLLQLQIHHVCTLYPSCLDFPHCFQPNPFLAVGTCSLPMRVWFHPFSLIPQNQPDLSQEHYLYRWYPLFGVMIKSPLLVAYSHPLASCDYLAHAHPSGHGLSVILVWQPYEPSIPYEAGGHALLFSVPWSRDLHIPMPLPYSPQAVVTTY